MKPQIPWLRVLVEGVVIVGSILLAFGIDAVQGAAGQVPPVLQSPELCSDNPDAAVVTFDDASLEATIKAALSVRGPKDLTCGQVSGLTALDAFNYSTGVTSLAGLENLTSLTASCSKTQPSVSR